MYLKLHSKRIWRYTINVHEDKSLCDNAFFQLL